jgi:hypothetical protein
VKKKKKKKKKERKKEEEDNFYKVLAEIKTFVLSNKSITNQRGTL